MPMWIKIVLCVTGAYLVGGIPFGLLFGKIYGVDIRKLGSGNIGATNVFRTIGARAGIPAFVLDVSKGLVPVLIWKYLVYCPADGGEMARNIVSIGIGIAAVLGHNFTPFLKFKGGKGVATTLGAGLGLTPETACTALLVFAAVVLASRYVSLGSLAAACVAPLFHLGYRKTFHPASPEIEITIFLGVTALLIVVRHRSNIRRLIAGTENRLGGKKETGP